MQATFGVLLALLFTACAAIDAAAFCTSRPQLRRAEPITVTCVRGPHDKCIAGEEVTLVAVASPGYSFDSCAHEFTWTPTDPKYSTVTTSLPAMKYTIAANYRTSAYSPWTLTVRNAQGTDRADIYVYWESIPCDPPAIFPSTMEIGWRGLKSGCTRANGVPCYRRETIEFTVNVGTFAPTPCDSFYWTWPTVSKYAESFTTYTTQSFVLDGGYPVGVSFISAAMIGRSPYTAEATVTVFGEIPPDSGQQPAPAKRRSVKR